MTRKIAGYNVYRAADGCDEEYFGFASSLRTARIMCRGSALPRSEYGTARAAGHCAGLSAPDKSREIEDHYTWLTRECVAVGVAAE